MFFLWRCLFVNDINPLSCTVCALIKDPSQIFGKRLHFCLCLCLMLNDIEVQSSCVLTLIPALFGWRLDGSMEFHNRNRLSLSIFVVLYRNEGETCFLHLQQNIIPSP